MIIKQFGKNFIRISRMKQVVIFLLLVVSVSAEDNDIEPLGKNCPITKNPDYICEASVNLAADFNCWMPSNSCEEKDEDRCFCRRLPNESFYGKCVITWRCIYTPFTTTTEKIPDEPTNLTVGQIIAISVVVSLFVIGGIIIGCYFWIVKCYIPSIAG